MQQQHGFTLVELIIVIVILGILAVTAAPKLIDISSDAKKANYVALTAAIKSAAEMVRMKCMVDSGCDMNGNSSINVGGNVILVKEGYPYYFHMGDVIVDSGEWERSTFLSTVYYFYPGSGDCVISYTMSFSDTSPSYNTTGAVDTCS